MTLIVLHIDAAFPVLYTLWCPVKQSLTDAFYVNVIQYAKSLFFLWSISLDSCSDLFTVFCSEREFICHKIKKTFKIKVDMNNSGMLPDR